MAIRSAWTGWAALLTIAGVCAAPGEVVVRIKQHPPIIGESVLSVDTNRLVLKVCHSFVHTIPADVIESYEETRYDPVEYRVRRPARRPARLTAPVRRKLTESISDYFRKPAERSATLEALRRRDALAAADVPWVARHTLDCARDGPKLRQGDFTFDHPEYKGEVHVDVHTGTGRTPGATNPPPQDMLGLLAPTNGAPSYALVLLLHGGGENDGHWSAGTPQFVGPFRTELGDTVFLFPTVLQRRYAEWGKYPFEEAYVKELIKAAKRTWPIDTDRVYCAGFSMGAYGTWHFGGHQADVFAGLVSGAGGILVGRNLGELWGWGVLSNLAHTRIEFRHAKDDGPSPVWSDQTAHKILTELGQRYPGRYRHRYVEFETGGHGGGGRGLDEGARWVAGFRREPYPKWVAWEPSRPFIRHFYWLYAAQPKFFSRLVGEIDGNTVRIKTHGPVGDFSVLLNERLVAVDRPVTVIVNGRKRYRGPVQPSVTAIVESIEDKIDPRMWFWARIDFEAVPAK